jgi:glycosyltransferase involved in cell wall biosynthesis
VHTELVSVIIPTFNRAYCIERAIGSALAQTHPHLEIVVVDDGSTDNTAELMRARYGSDPRVRYVHQANGGVCAARNTGFEEATGSFVALLDSDDAWKPWKLELQLACMARLPDIGMVWTDMDAVDPHGNPVKARYLRTMYSAYERYPTPESLFDASFPAAEVAPAIDAEAANAIVYHGDIFTPMVIGNLVHTSTVLLRRERLREVGGFNLALKRSGEDYDFHLRTCLAGTVAYIDTSSILYQVDGEDQLTQPKYALDMARNKLRTIEPIIALHRDRIDLSAKEIANVQAKAHAWIGREALIAGNDAEARHHLVRSVGYRRDDWSTWAQLAMAWTPSPLRPVVRHSGRFAVQMLSLIGLMG